MKAAGTRAMALVFSLALLGALGCTDDDTTALDGGGIQPDGGAPDASAPANTLKVKVLVSDISGGLVIPGSQKPASGVTVTALLPGGVSEEKTTGADGTATFTAVDWTRPGTAAVTAYKKDHTMRTAVGLTVKDMDQTMTIYRHPKPTTVTVSGTIKNATLKADYYVVSVSGSPNLKTSPASYSLDVPSGKPFSLYVMAVDDDTVSTSRFMNMDFELAKKDHAGSTKAVAMDIDFASDALTLTTVKGTMVLPTSPGYVGSASRPMWGVFLKDYSAMVGYVTKTSGGDGGKFTFEGKIPKLPAGTEVMTRYRAFMGTGGGNSAIFNTGFPKEGATVGVFPHQAVFTAPAKTDQAFSRKGTITWTNPEAALMPQLRVAHGVEERLAWQVDMPLKTSSLPLYSIPLPAKLTGKQLFGTEGSVDMKVFLGGGWNKASHRWDRASSSMAMKLDTRDPF